MVVAVVPAGEGFPEPVVGATEADEVQGHQGALFLMVMCLDSFLCVPTCASVVGPPTLGYSGRHVPE